MDLATLLKTTNPYLLLAIFSVVMIGLSLGLGVLFAGGGQALSRWLRATAPNDKAVDAFEKRQLQAFVKAQADKKPFSMTTLNEPIIISVIGFVITFIMAGALIAPPTVEAPSDPNAPPKAKPLAVVKDPEKAAKTVAELPKGNAANGKALYEDKGCVGCHTLDGKSGVGPTFQGSYTRAASRKPDYGSKEYIYESIVNPSYFIVDGFQQGIMPNNYNTQIKPQEMADLLAWFEANFK
jgi:cytochrome c oxidase subunit 2